MKILGIDTSCDDTCIAVLEIKNSKLEILSNIVSSQVKLHAKYGGVYPMLAKREHQRNLPIVLNKALRKAGFVNSKFKIQNSKIDLIAVTVGPGLEPCLWQGVNFAKELAGKLNKPLIPVNHIEAHIVANWLPSVSSNFQFPISNFQTLFPAVCLVVSGGHTQLILMRDIGKYRLIGETRDDAAGECFDKAARILGLGYPGGPVIDAGAAKYRTHLVGTRGISECRVKLPRPMMHTKDYDFSFSGLKTAVLYKVKSEKRKAKSKKYVQEMCFETQQAIIDVLIYKTLKAVKNYRAKAIILGGGVAASEELRKQFKSKVKSQMPKIKLLVSPKILCRDNAAMVGVAAYFHRKEAIKKWQKIEANANFRI